MVWFLYDSDLCQERVNAFLVPLKKNWENTVLLNIDHFTVKEISMICLSDTLQHLKCCAPSIT